MSNVLFWRESGYFAAASELNPLLHTWSLAVEEQYYILFPLVLWACWRWFPRGGVLILGLIMVGSLVLAEVLSTRMPSANFYLLPTRAWELLAGSLAALYLLRRRAPQGWVAEALGLAGMCAITFAVITYDAATPFPSLWAMAPVLGTVAIIVAATPATLVGKLLGAAPLVGIGLISYSAYLWHQPLFAFARLLTPIIIPSRGSCSCWQGGACPCLFKLEVCRTSLPAPGCLHARAHLCLVRSCKCDFRGHRSGRHSFGWRAPTVSGGTACMGHHWPA